ncbi:hypothetical protein PE066_12760 [Ramlibacter tataouinensis]|uniref:hypothetical protein n=1 Tax=Ramlibacter tataouinensis TaxID=94132 RepID=UPI0022F3B538|nr:hypothetical protein [Ramlibacter tataouinensis]WBY00344.1 hypothetical protein PE066_12760 [Ramlibacter tataouinensis]
MNRRLVSALAYGSTVAAATLASALMTASANAETPLVDTPPFVSTRSRADVRAEVMSQRDMLTAAGGEWASQGNMPQPRTSQLTRAQVTADYIASRDAVRAFTSEDSGSAYLAQHPMGSRATLLAGREETR